MFSGAFFTLSGEIFGDVFRIAVASLRTRPRKDPREIRMIQVERIPALATRSTRRCIGGAEQCLGNPQTESWLADTRGPMQEQALWQRSSDDPWQQPIAQDVVA